MLAESERLFARDRLLRRPRGRARAQGLRPDRLREALQPAARRARLGPRDGAQHLRLADRPRARASSASRSTRPRATRSRSRPGSSSTSTRCPTRSSGWSAQGYEDNPGIRPGDIFANNDPTIGDVHNADVQTFVPIFDLGDPERPELVAWAGGVTHVLDIGASTPGGVPVGPTNRLDDGIDLPCMKIGEGDEIARWHLERCAKQTRAPMYYLLDERTRLAGCHMVREAVERVILEEGVDRFKQFSREVIEEGRRSFKSPDPRDDRPRPLPDRVVHGQHLRRQGRSCRRGRGATSSCTPRSRCGSAATATTRSTSTAPRPGAGTR